jgi:hypothetical protein
MAHLSLRIRSWCFLNYENVRMHYVRYDESVMMNDKLLRSTQQSNICVKTIMMQCL